MSERAWKSFLSRFITPLGQSRHQIAFDACSLFSQLTTPSSIRYSDSEFEYRHVQLPKAMLKAIPKEYHDSSKGTLKLLWEDEWRSMGITQVWNASKRARHTKLWRRDRGTDSESACWLLMRSLQSLGWEHYEVHEPEPHILLFKYVVHWTPPLHAPSPPVLAVLARAHDQLTCATGGHSTTNHLRNEGSMTTMAAMLRQHVYLISHSTTA